MNWGQLKTAIQQYLESSETTFVANLPLFARLAEEDIYRQVQLPFLRATSTSTILISDRFLATPADYMSTYSLAVIIGGMHKFLLHKPQSFLREAYPDPLAIGEPRYYTNFDEDSLMVAPTPDDNYSVELNYFFKPTSISQGDVPANTNWLSENAEEALVFGTLVQGYIYLKGDQDVIQSYMQKYNDAIAALKIIAEGRNRKDTYRMADERLKT